MSGSCVVDTDAVLRFGIVALQVFRDFCAVFDTAAEAVVTIADLIPQSETAPQWCESAGAAIDIVRRSVECFRRLAEHTEQAVEAFSAIDRCHAADLRRLAAGI
ncbi:hypothetical protein [Nocardia mexicana]|uniref:Uncharacterized protein n=1 Tax=Nocardia mexicana TaxID=279262 RepID=A0A370H5K7_9NOCA|nr:hypothetical protein [Nocardia mexicana]RDI51653.1 hypothetical protein DFR68_104137 [Nocardia mexicana]